MSEVTAKIKRKNFFLVEGFLKENNLELVSDKNNDQVIRGSLIIAVSENDAHRIQFYVNKKMKNGEENEVFSDLLKLLPANTVSVASYLKSTPTANFANAANAASKIWATGRLEEFASKDESNKETSMVTLKGRTAGLKTLTDRHPFDPKAMFDIDVYIEKKIPEIVNGAETGRYLITGLVPVYDGSMHRIDFVTDHGQASEYVNDNYNVTQTANFNGTMKSIVTVTTNEPTVGGWGTQRDQTTTTFVRERVITGGAGAAKDPDDPGAITTKEVKDGLITRETKAIENGKRKKTTVATPTPGFTGNATPAAGNFGTAAASAPGFDFNDF